jgi:hypothetical protein
LVNCIRDEEIRRLENGGTPASNDQLFDRSVFKTALPTVSGARLNQYLYAEYPGERSYISKLEGEKAEQTPESLANLWSVSRDDAIAEAKQLVELGFFEERGTKEDPTYWVPFLYRDALNLVQGKADTARPSLARWDNGPWGNCSDRGFYRSLARSKQTLGPVSR